MTQAQKKRLEALPKRFMTVSLVGSSAYKIKYL